MGHLKSVINTLPPPPYSSTQFLNMPKTPVPFTLTQNLSSISLPYPTMLSPHSLLLLFYINIQTADFSVWYSRNAFFSPLLSSESWRVRCGASRNVSFDQSLRGYMLLPPIPRYVTLAVLELDRFLLWKETVCRCLVSVLSEALSCIFLFP